MIERALQAGAQGLAQDKAGLKLRETASHTAAKAASRAGCRENRTEGRMNSNRVAVTEAVTSELSPEGQEGSAGAEGRRGVHGGSAVKNLPAGAGDSGLSPGQEAPWRRAWQPTPVSLPEESHGEEPGRLQTVGTESQTQLRDYTTPADGQGHRGRQSHGSGT